MRRDEDRFAFVAQIVEQIPDSLPMHRIESGSRFIQKKQRRIVNQRATEREQLAHAAGQASRRGRSLLFEIGQAQQSADARFQFRRGNTTRAAKET